MASKHASIILVIEGEHVNVAAVVFDTTETAYGICGAKPRELTYLPKNICKVIQYEGDEGPIEKYHSCRVFDPKEARMYFPTYRTLTPGPFYVNDANYLLYDADIFALILRILTPEEAITTIFSVDKFFRIGLFETAGNPVWHEVYARQFKASAVDDMKPRPTDENWFTTYIIYMVPLIAKPYTWWKEDPHGEKPVVMHVDIMGNAKWRGRARGMSDGFNWKENRIVGSGKFVEGDNGYGVEGEEVLTIGIRDFVTEDGDWIEPSTVEANFEAGVTLTVGDRVVYDTHKGDAYYDLDFEDFTISFEPRGEHLADGLFFDLTNNNDDDIEYLSE